MAIPLATFCAFDRRSNLTNDRVMVIIRVHLLFLPHDLLIWPLTSKQWYIHMWCNIHICSKLSYYIDFRQNVWKSRFTSKFSIIWILIKFYTNLDFSQNFEKSRFWWKFWNNSTPVKKFGNLDFSENIKIYKSLNFSQIFQQILIFVNIVDFVDILEKSRFWSHSSEISILTKFSTNLDFGQNFRKSRFSWKFTRVSILVKIFKKSRFWSKFSTNYDFCKNFRKSWFWSILP